MAKAKIKRGIPTAAKARLARATRMWRAKKAWDDRRTKAETRCKEILAMPIKLPEVDAMAELAKYQALTENEARNLEGWFPNAGGHNVEYKRLTREQIMNKAGWIARHLDICNAAINRGRTDYYQDKLYQLYDDEVRKQYPTLYDDYKPVPYDPFKIGEKDPPPVNH
jgi:hypothetical protein